MAFSPIAPRGRPPYSGTGAHDVPESRQHPRRHRADPAGRPAPRGARQRRPCPRETGVPQPDRQRQGPDGAGDDRGGRSRRAPAAGRSRRRVHGREHRRLPGAGLRREAPPAPHRLVRRVLEGEARPHAPARGHVADRPERCRPHDRAVDAGHDRRGGRGRQGDGRLLDRPDAQPRSAGRVPPDGGRDLAADRRTPRGPRPDRGHRRVDSRPVRGPAGPAPRAGHRGGGAARVGRAVRRPVRRARDRRRGGRLRGAAVGRRAGRRHRTGVHRGGDGEGVPAGPRGRPVRGHVHRRPRDRGPARGRTARPRRHRRDGDVRH
jgi:hypothetical protein